MVVVTAHITTVIAADTRMKKKATIQVTGTLPLMQAAQPIKGTSEVSKAALRAVSVMMPRGERENERVGRERERERCMDGVGKQCVCVCMCAKMCVLVVCCSCQRRV